MKHAEGVSFAGQQHRISPTSSASGTSGACCARPTSCQARIDSDVTMLMSGNEYRGGVLCGVPAAEAAANREAARRMSLALVHFLQTEVEPATAAGAAFPASGRGPMCSTPRRPRGAALHPRVTPHPRRVHGDRAVIPSRAAGPAGGAGAIPGRRGGGRLPYRCARTAPGGAELHAEPAQASTGRSNCRSGRCCRSGSTTCCGVQEHRRHPRHHGCFRLHPNEWSTGEAAGHLAAFCLDHGVRPRAVRADPRLVAGLHGAWSGTAWNWSGRTGSRR